MHAGAATPGDGLDVMTWPRLGKQLRPFVSTLLLFLVWETACRAFRIPTFILPTPSESIAALIEDWSGIWPNALHTLVTTLIGFGAAVVVGVVLGIVVGTSSLVYDSVNPLLIGFNAIPKVALVPILVLWFGIGTVPAVITAFLTAFFPIVVNVATGIATVEPELNDVLRSLGASRIDVVRKVGIPRSMPYLFASLKIAIALAFVGAVVSESIASNVGIGYLMLTASATFRIPLVFAGLLVIAAMGIIMYMVAAGFERRWASWSTRGSEVGGYMGGG
jgi:NitT/TauT family transport system permease protein